MANLRMVTDNYIDTSILSATPTLSTTLNQENLKNVSRAKVTRSTSASIQEISGIFNEEKTVSSIIIGRHNFPEGTLYRAILYSDNAYTTSIYDTGNLVISADELGSDLWTWGDFLWGATAWGADRQIEAFAPKANLAHWLPSEVQARSFKLIIDVPVSSGGLFPMNKTYYPIYTGTNTHFEIGRLIIGKYIEPTYNTSYGHNISWVEDTKQYRTDAGTLRSDISLPNRRFEFDIGTMTEIDRTLIQNALRRVGLRKDIFISLFPEDPDVTKQIDYSGIVKLVKVPTYTEYAPKYYKSKYIMEEV